MEYITGAITLQAIFSLYWEPYLSWYKGKIREAVYENVQKIIQCRTPMLGFHVYQCPHCLIVKLMPHSCKSRFCSSCGKIATDKWTEERLSDILPTGYHHLVFTLPWQLRAITLLNREIMLNIFFRAASKSIMDWTKRYGRYIPGFYTVLHSFGSDLKWNSHFHILITAGGLSLDHSKWIHAPQNFLMPEKGLKKRWKWNVIRELIDANNKGLLKMPYLVKKDQYINLRGVISVISKLCWYINIGACLFEVGISIRYIGRYTKKPVIAETRILNASEKWIIFKYKDYAEGEKTSIKKMGTFTFISYLTQHIHDRYFRVVRGYGIFSNRLKGTLLTRAKEQLEQTTDIKGVVNKSFQDWRERISEYTGKDPLICEDCKVEMKLVFVCYSPNKKWLKKLRIGEKERIPIQQIKLKVDTS